jgi:hypothetical protein
MRAIPVIVLEVGAYQSEEMVLPEDDKMIEQLAPVVRNYKYQRVGVLGTHSQRLNRHISEN